MPQPPDYIIVGTEIGESNPKDANVEMIGRLMVEMSKKKPSPAKIAKLREQIRQCLTVKSLNGAASLSAVEKAEILSRTKVKLLFETRAPGPDGKDVNTRYIVVPCDRTLELREAGLAAAATAGFEPPLAYALDYQLMWSSLRDDILGMVASFVAGNPAGLTPPLAAALKAHFEAAIDAKTYSVDATGALDPAAVQNEILKSPRRAFHRSVGIYATNMCR